MKGGGKVLVGLAVGVVLLVAGHLALIEIGREVVTLRTPLPDGGWQATRLWVVDHDGAAWLHSAGDSWRARFAGDPVVELERNGGTRRYRATLVSGPHPAIDRRLREKYGVADRWVRLLAPCNEDVTLARLDPVSG